jgi:2-polyprenyl-3-methyl-5-hydroxy-6-metoxy-1,4-benzoquinol methylase
MVGQYRKKLNPGGSLGDSDFPVPEFNSVEEIEYYLKNFHGYEYLNNMYFIEELAGKEIAEVGCGHGLISILLSLKTKSLIGYDIDEKSIKYAQSLIQKLGLYNISFEQYNGTFDSIDKTYDAVISMDVIEHVYDPIAFLQNVFKILRPGGMLILGTTNGLIANGNRCIIRTHSRFHIMEYAPDELSNFLNESGFSIESCYSNKNISGGGYSLSFTKKSIIKFLCLFHLFEFTSKLLIVLKQAKRRNFETGKTERNSYRDWSINYLTFWPLLLTTFLRP